MAVPVNYDHPEQQQPRPTKRGILALAVLYFILLSLLAAPFYDWLYHWGITLIYFVFLVASFAAVPLFVSTLSPRRGLAFKLALGALLMSAVLTMLPISGSIRLSIARTILESQYCDLQQPVPRVILGGLVEIGPTPPRTGAFEDTSVCLGPSCREQFITCQNSVFRDDR
jgi:hypothetical protein